VKSLFKECPLDIKKIKENKELLDRITQILQENYKASENFNKFFNEFNITTDRDEQIVLKSIKERDFEYKFDASEILFHLDNNGYLDELENWNGQQIQDNYKEAISHLEKTNQKAIFLNLVDAIKKKRVAPFVGAGVSKACGYLLWGESLKAVVEQIKDADLTDINSAIEKNDYMTAAELIYKEDRDSFVQFIKTEFRLMYSQDDDNPPIFGPVKLLPKITSGCIITTNFDELIEQVFILENKPLSGYMHGLQPGHNFIQRMLRGDHCILKLHGHFDQDNSYVFTDTQYNDAYGDPISYELQLPKALRQIYINNSLLFLGCSLEQDKTLDLFHSIIETKHFEIPEHFAFLPEPKSGKRDKRTRLLRLNIQPIWYPVDKNHTFVEKLLDLAIASSERKISIG
jgi:hypothetical protein